MIYVAADQTRLIDALANTSGSSRYTALLHELGNFETVIGGQKPAVGYRGGVGEGTVVAWRDTEEVVVWHVASLLPSGAQNQVEKVSPRFRVCILVRAVVCSFLCVCCR